MKTLGQQLKALRERDKKTQERVAQDLGMGQGMISGYEKDKGDPTLSTLKRLAAYYSVPVGDLVLGEANEEEQTVDAQRLEATRLILGAHPVVLESALIVLRRGTGVLSADDKDESSTG